MENKRSAFKKSLPLVALIGGAIAGIGYFSSEKSREGLEKELYGQCTGTLSYVISNDTIRLRDVKNFDRTKDYKFDIGEGFIYDKFVDLEQGEVILSVGYHFDSADSDEQYKIMVFELETCHVKATSELYKGSAPIVGATTDKVFLASVNLFNSLTRKNLTDLATLKEYPQSFFHGRYCPDGKHEFNNLGYINSILAIEDGNAVAAQRWLKDKMQ